MLKYESACSAESADDKLVANANRAVEHRATLIRIRIITPEAGEVLRNIKCRACLLRAELWQGKAEINTYGLHEIIFLGEEIVELEMFSDSLGSAILVDY